MNQDPDDDGDPDPVDGDPDPVNPVFGPVNRHPGPDEDLYPGNRCDNRHLLKKDFLYFIKHASYELSF